MKVTNTEMFISKASTIHNNKYDYSNVNFVNSKTKVRIICSVHGEFLQTPNNHLTGYGCAQCSYISNALVQSNTTDIFVAKAISIHGTRYNYSQIKYKNSKTPVTILCPEHGAFEMSPSNHTHKTQPQGCPTCGILQRTSTRKHNLDAVKALFFKTHGNNYNYSKMDYTNYRTKVTITCPIHGDFEQTPAHHIGGTGCPSCAEYGFNPNKPAILYYLSINNGEAYKIGVTNRTVDARFSTADIRKIEVLFTHEFTTGSAAYLVEQQLLKHFKECRYTGPDLLQSGNTELITTDKLDTIEKVCANIPHNATIDEISIILESLCITTK